MATTPARILVAGLYLLLSAQPGEAAQKRVLLELYTGAWCGWCPDGEVRLLEALAVFPGRVVPVGIHDGDAMALGTSLPAEYADGFPAGIFDRTTDPPRNTWLAEIASHLAEPPRVELVLQRQYSADTRVLNVTLSAELLEATSSPMLLHVFLTEDHVEGSGSGYDQVNYYDTDANHPYFGAGNPVAGFSHRYVLRAILVGETGGEVAAGLAAGQVVEETYSYQLPPEWNPERMAVVAFLAVDDPSPFSREVWNAVHAPLIAPPSSGCGHRVDADGEFATLVLLALAMFAMSSRPRPSRMSS